jgi:hypothetical protein
MRRGLERSEGDASEESKENQLRDELIDGGLLTLNQMISFIFLDFFESLGSLPI